MERDSSSMVLVQIGWRPQPTGPGPAQYLVTWELSGGGIKGHLYTDINSVTLSLWPESVYNIQVGGHRDGRGETRGWSNGG